MSAALTRLNKEVVEMARYPPPNCTASPIGDNVFKWQATVMGPKNSPYEGGRFELLVTFPQEYPMRPPFVQFVTQVYHPNVSTEGNICMDILSGGAWSPMSSISKVLLSICALLCKPNPDSVLRQDIGNMLKMNPAKYEENARLWTDLYAKGLK